MFHLSVFDFCKCNTWKIGRSLLFKFVYLQLWVERYLFSCVTICIADHILCPFSNGLLYIFYFIRYFHTLRADTSKLIHWKDSWFPSSSVLCHSTCKSHLLRWQSPRQNHLTLLRVAWDTFRPSADCFNKREIFDVLLHWHWGICLLSWTTIAYPD